jgi:flagellar basal-body rod modification protein FlgD
MSTAITSTTGVSTSATTTEQTLSATKTLGQEDFLKLLVAQLSTQDPLNPTKDTDFIAQMAQFSSLEQTKTMGDQLSSLRLEQEFLQSNQLLGRTVELQGDDNTTNSGVVTAMRVEDGTPKIEVNGQLYGLEQVLSVTPTPINH